MSSPNGTVRLKWSLMGSGLGDVIAGAGNSGNWPSGPPYAPTQQNAMTAVDLRDADDLILMVAIAAIVSTPSITVNVDFFDNQGNLYPAQMTSGALTSAGTKVAYAGSHGPSGSYLIPPSWGRVSWTCTGGSATGCDIELWAR